MTKVFHADHANVFVINDGTVLYNNDCFAPGISRAALTDLRCGHHANEEHFTLTHNILLLALQDRVVLIDAGNGHTALPGAGQLSNNLMAAGFQPDDVTDIVLTHAHPDHIDGLIDARQQLVFPKAAIHLAKEEYAFWHAENPDFSKSKNTLPALKSLQQHICGTLALVQHRLQLFDGQTPLFDFLLPIAAPGHTPGHYLFEITTASESFIHMGDICHEALVLFAQPEWGTVFDIDFTFAAQTRRKVLDDLAQSQQLVFGYHLPWPGFGHVVKENDRFAWR
ncbi:MBL fold metallo-hydrolase [Chitinophaga vietnamensis]|uniref:MBL fold metallo-hydrolase n=1 Tax=Chitinophaga vietnamensis TaxID=2593957 RepID=UPI0011773EB9|nr:MBL fold metallo-hydrolase [Chitinophaga vietnamensis]